MAVTAPADGAEGSVTLKVHAAVVPLPESEVELQAETGIVTGPWLPAVTVKPVMVVVEPAVFCTLTVPAM